MMNKNSWHCSIDFAKHVLKLKVFFVRYQTEMQMNSKQTTLFLFLDFSLKVLIYVKTQNVVNKDEIS